MATRNRLDGVRWPVTNPKVITVDYSNEEEVIIVGLCYRKLWSCDVTPLVNGEADMLNIRAETDSEVTIQIS